MAAINFPEATQNGQVFEADTGVVYTYIGTPPNGYWSGMTEDAGSITLNALYVAKDDKGAVQTITGGGGLDLSGSIQFNSTNGNATFGGKVTSAATTDGDADTTLVTKGYLEDYTGGIGTYVRKDGDTMSGNLHISDKITFETDGDITTTGKEFRVGTGNYDNSNPGVLIGQDGGGSNGAGISIFHHNASDTQAFGIYGAGINNRVSWLDNLGNASFNSNVTAAKFLGDGSGLTNLGIPTVGSGTITIRQPGISDKTFNVNQSGDTTIDLLNDNTQGAAPGNGTITIVQPGTNNQTFTVNQSGNKTITLKNDNTVPSVGNGALTIRTAGENKAASGSFSANQSGSSTITLPTIRYGDLSGRPSIPTMGNGTITITQPGVSNQSFTVNQSGNTTIALKNDNTVTTPGNGTITIVQPGVSNQTFTVNQSGNKTITLKNDNTVVTPGNGTVTITQNGSNKGSFTMNQGGNTTIALTDTNTQNPNQNLQSVCSIGASYSGTITAANFNSTSDAAMKHNINPIDNALELINQIVGVRYNWNSDDSASAGVLAQDVETVLPELVATGDHKSVNYNGLVGVLIQAVKELSAEVTSLKNKVS